MSQIFIPHWTSQAAERGMSRDRFIQSLNHHLRYEVNVKERDKHIRDARCRQITRAKGKHFVEGLGDYLGTISEYEYQRALQIFGEGCMDDRQFVREYFRDNEECRAQ